MTFGNFERRRKTKKSIKKLRRIATKHRHLAVKLLPKHRDNITHRTNEEFMHLTVADDFVRYRDDVEDFENIEELNCNANNNDNYYHHLEYQGEDAYEGHAYEEDEQQHTVEENLQEADYDDSADNARELQNLLILQEKAGIILNQIGLLNYLIEARSYSTSVSRTMMKRSAEFLAFALFNMEWDCLDEIPDHYLLSVIYAETPFLLEYCESLSDTRSYKPGTVVNILSDINVIAEWLHLFMKSKHIKRSESSWHRFTVIMKNCKRIWRKKERSHRMADSKSIEELIASNKLPKHGMKNIQEIVLSQTPIITGQINACIRYKVIHCLF